MQKNIETTSISYEVDGQQLIGYFACEADASSLRPGILVVHEWTGLNDYAKKRARDLAALGYAAFAVDMYGEGREIPVEQAREISSSVGRDFPLIRRRFNAALEVLNNRPESDSRRTAAIGYCFGGGILLNMARMGTDIAGVVSFHGTLNTGLTAKPNDIAARVLAFQGDGDPVAPTEVLQAFDREMADAKADYQFIVYPGVNAHNFTNPEAGSYYPAEAEDAWKKMLAFLEDIL